MNTLLKAGLLSVAACGVMGSAWAAETTSPKYLAVSGYFVDPDDMRGTDRAGIGAELAFGMQLTGPLYAEVRGFGAILNNASGVGADFYNGGAGLDLHMLLGQRGQFSAFVLAGAGLAYNKVNQSAQDKAVFQGNAGVGLLSRGLTQSKIRIRLEARTIYEDYLGGVNDFRVGLGIEIPVDTAEIIVREVPVERIVERGPAQGAYPTRPLDSDGDGILEHFDVCPGTLPNVMVDRSGCALAAQTVTLKGVQFELNSADLTPQSLTILDGAVNALRGQPGMTVAIEGHTDGTGSAVKNKALSLQRAMRVKTYLVVHGIASKRLRVAGYGGAHPIDTDATAAGRAANRRVEFQIGGADEK